MGNTGKDTPTQGTAGDMRRTSKGRSVGAVRSTDVGEVRRALRIRRAMVTKDADPDALEVFALEQALKQAGPDEALELIAEYERRVGTILLQHPRVPGPDLGHSGAVVDAGLRRHDRPRRWALARRVLVDEVAGQDQDGYWYACFVAWCVDHRIDLATGKTIAMPKSHGRRAAYVAQHATYQPMTGAATAGARRLLYDHLLDEANRVVANAVVLEARDGGDPALLRSLTT